LRIPDLNLIKQAEQDADGRFRKGGSGNLNERRPPELGEAHAARA
jgi:hypothetical protein